MSTGQPKEEEKQDPGANRKEELRALALQGGALVMGIAGADSFTAAPQGHRPTDLLPHARSVIVLGGARPRAGDWQSPNYQHMEVTSISDRITVLGNRVAQHIESAYKHYAVNVPPGVDRARHPFMSLALAAELAGCGSASLAGPILNRDHGFMYYSAVITTLALPPDVPVDAPACPAPECVEMWNEHSTTPCMSICPIDDGGCIGGKIVDGNVAERRFDRARCTTRVETYWIPGFQKALGAALDEQDKEKRSMILGSSFFTRTLWSMTYSNVSQGQCFECMRVCPVARGTREMN